MTDPMIARHALDIVECPPEQAAAVARAHYAETMGEPIALVESLLQASEGHNMLAWADRVQTVRKFIAAFREGLK